MTVNFIKSRVTGSILVSVLVLLALGTFQVDDAVADYNFPRLGLSAVPNDYVAGMEAVIGDTFTVYVGAFGTESGLPLEDDMVSMAWVVHQVCCGADLYIVNHEFVGDFVSEGHPLGGVSSVAPDCVSADFITLAILDVVLETPDGPGDYLMSAGPYNASYDCAGESPIFLEGVLTVSATGELTPVVETTWSGLKAYYR